MADDKQPPLDPSQNSDDEATQHHHNADETQALPGASEEADLSEGRLDDDSDSAEHQAEEVLDAADRSPSADEPTEAVDPETRMLQQIAALKASEDSATLSKPADDASTEDPVGADDDDARTEEVSHTSVSYDTPISAQASETTQESTRVIEPIPVAAGSPDEPDTPSKAARKRKRRWPWLLVVLILVLGGGYVGAAFATQDSLPATLTVEDVDVSGMSTQEAAPVLEEAFEQRAQREISVTVEDRQATLVPAEAGYTYDVQATLEDLTELTFNPMELWARLFGEAHVQAVKTIDDETSQEAIAGLAEQLTFDPTEGAVVYEGAELEYTEPVDGFTVDEQELADLVADEWLGDETELTAPGEVEDPAVSAQEWEQFVTETAQPLVEDNVTVTADDATTELTPAQLGAAAEVRVEGAAEETAATQDTEQTPAEEDTTETQDAEGIRPVLLLDGEALTEALAENNADFASTNQDATVRLTGTAGSARPEVVPGSTGRGVDGQQVADEILADLAAEQTRSITVDLHEVEPEVTTEDAEAWDVNHVVAEYATPYPPHDGPRTANLRVGADRVNGTVVMPGEEFNLNSLLAPITAANGYHSSGVVESGVTTNAIGGGLSQIATMAYNAGFLGGMEIVEHKPHSRWFDRYPQGRESTYWEGQINVRWKNDTDAPVIVEMWLANNQVHTRLWGSDYYDVSTTTSEPYNFTASPTIRNSDSECIAERGGRRGFTVDVHRTKTPPDGEPIQETWRWAYSGWPTVICE